MQRWIWLAAAGMPVLVAASGCGRKAREERAEERAARLASKMASLASGKETKVDVSGATE
ncbi:MAG: hypothetical protein FJ279_01755 [Planctomycetes bacterium]|nr:hypothetical protein [Planctomycetota bacterium]